MDNLTELKQTLFNETLRAFNRVRLSRPAYGPVTLNVDTPEHDKALAEFSALYGVIEISGLEDEYQAWKQKEGESSVVEYGNPNLPKCVTGASGSGVCGNRDCVERQGIGCCVACKTRADCNSACGWLEEPAEV